MTTPTAARCDTLVDQLTLAEQVSLLAGQDIWSINPIERLSIGRLRVTDGPNGARGAGNLTGGVKSAAFPVGIALGATWNPDLLKRIGGALAEEVKDKSAHVLLAPTVNLQRGPLNGRNFECYSEDPQLTGALAVAYVQGLQAAGISATIKHFVGNESEIQRTTVSSDVDERSLRELYLVPFERAVKEAGVWGIMTSYNRLNGTFTSDHDWLLQTVLRQQWGYSGLVMSDWYGSHNGDKTLRAGLDLEMPGPTRFRGADVVAAVERGDLPAELVRRAALNVLRLMERTGAMDGDGTLNEQAVERETTRALIREAGADGMVLLKNEAVLPLAPGTKVALIGPNAATARCMGGGSAQLNAHRLVSPLEGLTQALGAQAITHATGCTNHRFEPTLTGEFTVDWYDNLDLSGDPAHRDTIEATEQFLLGKPGGGKVDPMRFSLRLRGTFTPEESGTHRIGLHVAGRAKLRLDGAPVIDAWDSWERGTTFFEEGCDPVTSEVILEKGKSYEIEMDFHTCDYHNLLVFGYGIGIGKVMGQAEIDAAADLAAQADVAVLCVGRSAEWDTEGWDLPSMSLPGLQDDLIRAVAAKAKRTVVLLQTGGPVEMPWIDAVDGVVQAWYGGQEAGHAIADVLSGAAEPRGRLAQSFPRRLADAPTMGAGALAYPGVEGHIRYDEQLEIGYRHHQRHDIEPLFSFGHGLGYTEFRLGEARISADRFEETGDLSVTVTLSNIGKAAGTTVVQLYVAPQDAPVSRPKSELKAFAKVSLDAGAAQEVTLSLSARDFAWFSVEDQAWQISQGAYDLCLGQSSDRIETRITVTRDTALVAAV
ncbi:Thermostable beta-glucosidase B [Aquimixticola soesokkakensis]|uniref:Beta-D-glucoside glucohydrolase n=1 Tax=Aquimixticola soesokkakensis TaxID=1519096 RepID=A0A1Y5RRS1_9RHOB|nr:glycoside hydrolase family 3 C-terminal domain-containing protein [Aquimixticola soesokkakensis]SLN23443.1 Thermostable beta-glucosidase B [Aquimixticola soesokkakensis]